MKKFLCILFILFIHININSVTAEEKEMSIVNLNTRKITKKHEPFKTGMNFFNEGKYQEALETWKKDLDDANNAGAAALMIGVIYENGGNGINKDIAKALEYYEKSLTLGYEPAKLHIGILYVNGKSPIKQDLQKAYEYIHSVENLDYELVYEVAYKFYLYGWGTAINIDKAKEIALKISDTDTRIRAFNEIKQQEKTSSTIIQSKDISNNTADDTSDTATAENLFNEGVKLCSENKYIEAMITFKKAVELGHGKAAAWIGLLYNNGGNGIVSNTKNAMKWFEKSKEMGYQGTNVFIASYYRNGNVVKQDINKAYQIIHEVEDIDLGINDNVIPLNAYEYYLYGWGTPVNYKRAYEIASHIHDKSLREKVINEIKQEEEKSRPIPAKTLISEVSTNQMRFDKNHKGRIIKCVGYVQDIEGGRRDYTLNLYYDSFIPNPFEFIHCKFSKKNEAELLNLNKGDIVTVQGLYKGKQDFQIGSIILFDCQIIKN